MSSGAQARFQETGAANAGVDRTGAPRPTAHSRDAARVEGLGNFGERKPLITQRSDERSDVEREAIGLAARGARRLAPRQMDLRIADGKRLADLGAVLGGLQGGLPGPRLHARLLVGAGGEPFRHVDAGGAESGERGEHVGIAMTVEAVGVRDFHATIMHLFGIDHERFTYKYQGLDMRLSGVEKAEVVKALLA